MNSPIKHPPFWLVVPHYRRGIALITVLVVITIISVVLVTFLTTMQQDRASSQSYSNAMQSDQIAMGALNQIIDDLRSEISGTTQSIIAGSSPTIYRPRSNTYCVPERCATTATDLSLVKISKYNSKPYTGGQALASDINSVLEPSLNGRILSATRWNKPALVSSQPTFPDWINVTRHGSQVVSKDTIRQNRDSAPDNPDFVVGRYSYAIYDVSGLIDITVAGYPTGISNQTSGRKGSLAWADLTQIPNGTKKLTQENIDELVQWRNAAITVSNYPTYVSQYGGTNGFLSVYPGNDTFINRQDLICYAKLKGITNALPYLTTFSREKNAPSWYPRYDASDLGGSGYSYKTNADQTTSVNRNLSNVRDTDGSLLLKKRFPLSYISLIDNGSSEDIEKYFGLAGSSSAGWIYNHGSATHIYTLDEVKAANREPDFFELLKATILQGSLGSQPGPSNPPYCNSGPTSIPYPYQNGGNDAYNSGSNLVNLQDLHIIQIGVNIIDQARSGNFPSTITFKGRDIYGIKNLPYLTRMLNYCYEETTGTVGSWLQPELWRLYQDPCSTSSPQNLPSQIRIKATGRSFTQLFTQTDSPVSGPVVRFDDTTSPQSLRQISVSPTAISYDYPVALTSTMTGIDTEPSNIKSAWTSKAVAFCTGTAPYIFARTHPLAVALFPYSGNNYLTFELQWLDDANAWHTYSKMEQLCMETQNWGCEPQPASAPAGYSNEFIYYYAKVDPRTDRIGTATCWYNAGQKFNTTVRPSSGNGFEVVFGMTNLTGFTTTATKYPGLLSDNSPSSSCYYTDPDQIVRRAAGAFADGSMNGYPLIPSASSSDNQHGRRSLMLNRPFQSVGELGYVYRDQPFKDLDFFTKESADAGLLDVFSAVNEPQVVAGRVSPNTPYPEILLAILKGSTTNINTGTNLSADADSIAKAIVTHVSDPAKGPLINRSDLVTELSTDIGNAISNPSEKSNKTQREAVVRALADVANTRTWNLLIDVVAQSGRYTSTASEPKRDFVVTGERRYWLHIAIDRYTGEIVDKQYELVTE